MLSGPTSGGTGMAKHKSLAEKVALVLSAVHDKHPDRNVPLLRGQTTSSGSLGVTGWSCSFFTYQHRYTNQDILLQRAWLSLCERTRNMTLLHTGSIRAARQLLNTGEHPHLTPFLTFQGFFGLLDCAAYPGLAAISNLRTKCMGLFYGYGRQILP